MFVGEGPGAVEDGRANPSSDAGQRSRRLSRRWASRGRGLLHRQRREVPCRAATIRARGSPGASRSFTRRSRYPAARHRRARQFAAQTLLATDTPSPPPRAVSLLRGVDVMPTFHPSYLLRNPRAKREVWRTWSSSLTQDEGRGTKDEGLAWRAHSVAVPVPALHSSRIASRRNLQSRPWRRVLVPLGRHGHRHRRRPAEGQARRRCDATEIPTPRRFCPTGGDLALGADYYPRRLATRWRRQPAIRLSRASRTTN
jgi:hypothetical protein